MPQVDDRAGPKYMRIADALAEDVYAGRLAVGERLPTHRDLAWRLGVTVGTVSRAYAEAERRGLVAGEVGRGSFVRAGARSAAMLAMPDPGGPQTIEMGINRPPPGIADAALGDALVELGRSPRMSELINYQAHTGRWEHRVAAARAITRRGYRVDAETVLVTSGAEHAIAATLTALCDPGDTVMVEQFTWSGTRALASLLRLGLKPVAMDAEGLLPDAFEAACRTTGARVLYTTPEIQNPTAAVLGEARRREIAEIARRHDVTIIEDDIYGTLPERPSAPIACFAPERTIYITGASKTLAPALRVGMAAVPRDRIGRFSSAARATNWMAPPLMAEVVSRWIEDGTADLLAARTRAVAQRRQAVAERMLRGFRYQTAPEAFHVWLELPEPWRAQDIVAAARLRNVSLTSTELFVPGREETPHAIRLSLTAARDEADLERGLAVLTETLKASPEPFLAVA
ncbi:MAG: aminotransferase class I/II-fold pyridoxal phosphate-dependent enzyme [Alphaproteobacteria bacterium]|nr:aminotransferase class I/II-fold pyridoxal phosphate-dependent enzyme [Alphaproteobacteria bacterium]